MNACTIAHFPLHFPDDDHVMAVSVSVKKIKDESIILVSSELLEAAVHIIVFSTLYTLSVFIPVLSLRFLFVANTK